MGAFRVLENTMRLETELEMDEPGFFRAVRVGNWIHWFDYITGLGEWTYQPKWSSQMDTYAIGQANLAAVRSDSLDDCA